VPPNHSHQVSPSPGTPFVRYNTHMERVRLILALMCVGLVCASLRADQQADLQKARADLQRQEMLARQREHYALELRSRMPLQEHQMSRIMRLQVDEGQLALRTTLAPMPNFERRRADIEGLPPGIVVYTQFVPGQPDGSQFEFTVEDYPDPLTNGSIHVLWRPGASGAGELGIVSSRQTRDHYARVIYQQYPGQVALIAYGADNSSSRDAENANLVERNFSELRRKHPAALEKWLRPVLHRLQQDAVFAADSNAAWQALAEDWPLDAAVQQRVERLVPDLNAPDWASRNRAANEIAKLGRNGATAITHLNRSGLSLEQNVRLDAILWRFRPLPADDVKPLRNNPNFLLDCEYSEDATVRKLAAARLTQILGHRLDLNLDAPDSMRAEGIERIRSEIKSGTGDQ
jgi:hypothetical protein